MKTFGILFLVCFVALVAGVVIYGCRSYQQQTQYVAPLEGVDFKISISNGHYQATLLRPAGFGRGLQIQTTGYTSAPEVQHDLLETVLIHEGSEALATPVNVSITGVALWVDPNGQPVSLRTQIHGDAWTPIHGEAITLSNAVAPAATTGPQ